MGNTSRRPKLTVHTRRYSKKRACGERKRRLALQNTANCKEIIEETTNKLFEIEETNNVEDRINIEGTNSENEELMIHKAATNEPEEQFCITNGFSIVDMQHIFAVAVIRRIFADAEGNSLNRNHYYYYQVQGQLHVTDFRRKDSREEVFWSEASVGL
ncbi:uncharacterized protein LOC123989278 [Osmia bicornis bicornis]|uniref:uncharacterized protein LOC123989278 n=1 Tax=Osmia bicornis bicornis TaxID=1437191 RepID=UPI001EAF5D20|nr:uncharacterized protein LOC123989278 [Osmia bicornis bicornis]